MSSTVETAIAIRPLPRRAARHDPEARALLHDGHDWRSAKRT
jgi:hypothetical protein